MAAKLIRSAECGKPEAAARFAHAQKFLEAADLVAGEAADGINLASASVAAALAVLAGIAASDAACCLKLGKRSRGEGHHQGADFLRKIIGGEKPADALTRLISLKDTAQYGVINISDAELTIAMRRARTLVEFAQSLFDAS